MSKPIILITSASGRIGRELIARLAQTGQFTIRACIFSPDYGPAGNCPDPLTSPFSINPIPESTNWFP